VPLPPARIALALGLLWATAASASAQVVLYDGLTPGPPQDQGWVTYAALPPDTYFTTGSGRTALDTTSLSSIKAGFSNYNLNPFAPGFQNPAFPNLDRGVGFVVTLDLKIIGESHSSKDRAGLSLIVLGSDKKGVELAFWADRIWTQSGANFLHAEEAAVDTTVAARRYAVTIHGDTYAVAVDGSDLLTGPVRDYSSFGAPYDRPGFVFLGDDTTSASASSEVSRLAVALLEGPAISVADASTLEGNSGSHALVFPVSLSQPSTAPVAVTFATVPGTADAGRDYLTTAGTLTFAPGVTSLPIDVPVLGDTLSEADETIQLSLRAPLGATIARGSAEGTIVDDDPLPAVSIADARAREGNGAVHLLTLRVTLSARSGRSVTVNYATGGGTAAPGVDYTPSAGTVTFAPSSVLATLRIPILADRVAEGTESFFVTLSAPVGAVIGRGQARATIIDDDGPRSPHTP
jgi:hypothetical protein